MTDAEKQAAKQLLSSRNAILPTPKELELIESGVHPELASILVDVMDINVPEDVVNAIIGPQ